MSLKNNTDYEFPEAWGLMTDEEKCEWYTWERTRRQANRQLAATWEKRERDRRESRRKSHRVDDELY